MVSYENQCKVAPVVTLLNPTDLRQPSHTRATHFFIPWYYTKKKRKVVALSRPISDHPRASVEFSLLAQRLDPNAFFA
jgi:hypothetical protein